MNKNDNPPGPLSTKGGDNGSAAGAASGFVAGPALGRPGGGAASATAEDGARVIPIAVARPAAAPPESSTVAMVRTLGLVSAICGLIIVGAYQGTYDAVAANKRIATERAVFKVLPKAKSIAEFAALPAGGISRVGAGDTALASGAVKFFAAYDADGKLAGIAAEGAAKGYADTVRIMFGYDPGCQCVIGIGVVSMRETPGIGDKIVTDRDFLANFSALDVKLKADLSALANEVKVVKRGSRAGAWQIDAIAGATITSRAVGKAINNSAQALLPRLVPQLEQIVKNEKS